MQEKIDGLNKFLHALNIVAGCMVALLIVFIVPGTLSGAPPELKELVGGGFSSSQPWAILSLLAPVLGVGAFFAAPAKVSVKVQPVCIMLASCASMVAVQIAFKPFIELIGNLG